MRVMRTITKTGVMEMGRHMDEIPGSERDYKHELNQAWEENDRLRSRIEELEEEVEEWKGGAETNFEALRMATEILNTAREALEKYADEKNWAADEGGYWSWPVPNPNDIMAIQKPWDIATRALEGMTNETSRSTKKSGHKSIHQKC